MSTLYAGPGKVFLNAKGLQANGENGEIQSTIEEETSEVAAGLTGRITEQLINQEGKIVITPFDNWGLLGTLYPARITTPAIGTRPHGAVNVPCKIWTQDGRIYNFVRSAVIKHPELSLGIGKPLFGSTEISCIGDAAKNLGDDDFLMTAAITESAGADPGGAMTMADFIRESWIGVWGEVDGFDAVESEEGWKIVPSVKYSPLKVRGLTRAMKLDSVAFMAKVRPYGPTHTQILAAVAAHTHGQRLGSADLVLTSASGKTITLKNAEIKGAGFDFGGTKLGSGEIGFVAEMTFTAGAVDPLIAFSA